MKHILESAESCGAHGVIGYCYWRIEQIHKEMNIPTAAINRMIDVATGYDKAKEKEWLDETIELLETVIENKKLIEADYENDEQMLRTIQSVAD